METLDLSVIIASYNTREFLRQCIQSIIDSTRRISLEIIVVDDCSKDGSCEMVEATFPGVRVLRNSQNLRYAKTNNRGLEESRGRYGLLLNSDTEVQPGAFDTLVEFMDRHPHVAAGGPKLINPDGSVQHCVRGFTGLLPMVFQSINLQLIWPDNPFTRPYYNTNLSYDCPKPVQSIGTTAFIIRRKVWEEHGMLDERFPHWYVDLAYCHHLFERQQPVYMIPDAVVKHYGSQSINQSGVQEIAKNHQALRLFYDNYIGKKHGPIKRSIVHACIPLRQLLKATEFKLSKDKRLIKGPGAPKQLLSVGPRKLRVLNAITRTQQPIPSTHESIAE